MPLIIDQYNDVRYEYPGKKGTDMQNKCIFLKNRVDAILHEICFIIERNSDVYE